MAVSLVCSYGGAVGEVQKLGGGGQVRGAVRFVTAGGNLSLLRLGLQHQRFKTTLLPHLRNYAGGILNIHHNNYIRHTP